MRASLLALAALLSSSSAAFVPSSQMNRPKVSLKASNANEQIPMVPGSTVAVITPMEEDTGKIDFEGLRNLLRYHVKSGTDNLCILGTTGEASVMTSEERKQVLTTAVDEVKGKMPILAGVGTINPTAVKEMMQQAADVGCDAGLVVTPYYVKPPQRGLIKHYSTVANYDLLPVVVYNVPGRTGVNFLDENIAAVALDHENIIAVKDATADLSRVQNMRNLMVDRKDFLLYSGDDNTSVDFVLQGGDGCISVTANLAAKEMHDLVVAALAGDEEKARAINEPLIGLHTKLFCEANPIPTKWAAKRVGLINSGFARPPLDEMDPVFEPVVEEALKQAGVLDMNTMA